MRAARVILDVKTREEGTVKFLRNWTGYLFMMNFM
jgi:hypothetical protein